LEIIQKGCTGAYRYGFNGKEEDSNGEWGGQSHYDYGFRIYNPSIAKFLSVDPLTADYPWYTPYQFAGNKPIRFIDLDGLEEADPFIQAAGATGTTVLIKEVAPPMTYKEALKFVGKGGKKSFKFLGGAVGGTVLFVFTPTFSGESAYKASLTNYESLRFKELAGKPYTTLSEIEKKELNNYYGKYEFGKDGSIHPRPMGSDNNEGNQEPPGIIYLRIDNEGLLKQYVGQTKSDERFKARKDEHARQHPDSDFEYTIIDRGHPGQDLNQREQRALDDRGGPTNQSNPDGGASNKRNVIRKK
jgi:RHS repeat-associated protein